MNKFFALLFVPLVLLPGLGLSYGAAGTVAAPYLELPMGARGEGMGEAFTAVADDVNAVYYNPAGLTSLNAVQLELMHVDSFGGVQYENAALAVPGDLLGINVWGTFALSYTLVGIDDTLRTQETFPGSGIYDQNYANLGYVYTAGASVVTMSYAWQATQLFSIGATLKAINEKIDTAEGWGVAGDIGLMTKPKSFEGVSAGMMLENVGTSPEPDSSLPTDLRLGMGYDWDAPFTGDQKADKMLFDLDLISPVVPVDQEWQLNLGDEYTHDYGNGFGALRVGYRFPQTTLGAAAGLTVGGGLGLHLTGLNLSFDYAWIPYGELGSQQRIALTADFGSRVKTVVQETHFGDYLYPPNNVAATGSDHAAHITWDPQTGTVDGYNIYMAYDPHSKQWTRLNKAPITTTSMSVKSLYNGYKVYFCVSTLARKSENLYRESDKSPAVMVIPH